MRYHLPPEEHAGARDVHAVAPVGAARGPTSGGHDPLEAPDRPILRSRVMPAAEAGAYLRRWCGEGPVRAWPIGAPAGIEARERSRPDRVHAGGRRRQRLALAVGAAEATALHWSVAEPVGPDDEEAWRRGLARLAPGPPREGRAWRA